MTSTSTSLTPAMAAAIRKRGELLDAARRDGTRRVLLARLRRDPRELFAGGPGGPIWPGGPTVAERWPDLGGAA